MTVFKNVRRTTRLVLAWFVLSMGVAALATWMDAGPIPMVCSSTGEMYAAGGAASPNSEGSASTNGIWKCAFCWLSQISTPISTAIHAVELVPAMQHGRLELPEPHFFRIRIALGARAPPTTRPI